MHQHEISLAPLFDAVLDACQRIRLSDGSPVVVSAMAADHVLPGRLYRLDTENGPFQFWLGVNAPRLIFSALAEGQAHYATEQALRLLSAAARTVSWDVLCEPLSDGTTGLTATCSADHAIVLVEPAQGSNEGEAAAPVLTPYGRYWALETALLAQGWLRICESYAIRSGKRVPMPY